jgi:hypothetical protein
MADDKAPEVVSPPRPLRSSSSLYSHDNSPDNVAGLSLSPGCSADKAPREYYSRWRQQKHSSSPRGAAAEDAENMQPLKPREFRNLSACLDCESEATDVTPEPPRQTSCRLADEATSSALSNACEDFVRHIDRYVGTIRSSLIEATMRMTQRALDDTFGDECECLLQ